MCTIQELLYELHILETCVKGFGNKMPAKRVAAVLSEAFSTANVEALYRLIKIAKENGLLDTEVQTHGIKAIRLTNNGMQYMLKPISISYSVCCENAAETFSNMESAFLAAREKSTTNNSVSLNYAFCTGEKGSLGEWHNGVFSVSKPELPSMEEKAMLVGFEYCLAAYEN